MVMRSLLPHLLLLFFAIHNGAARSPEENQVVFGVQEQRYAPANYTSSHSDLGIGSRVKRIAIVGAGAGGSSTAYFLSKAQQKLSDAGRGQEGFEVTLFERDERIGGRTAVVHPYFDDNLPAIELGASIFADVNRNMKRAAQDFNLETDAKLGEPGTVGVWDGQQFLVEGLDNGWWNSAKMFWRYGYSPVTTQKVVKRIVDRFVELYDPSYLHKSDGENRTSSGFPWTTIEHLAKAMELDDLAARDAGGYFYEQGISKLFVEEMIEAATLVNYGQEIYSIHGVGGGVSLAASGAVGVRGGNQRIFEEFLGHCDNLKLRLGVHGEVTGMARFRSIEEVVQAGKMSKEEASAAGLSSQSIAGTTLSNEQSGRTTKWWLGTKSGYGDLFDAVFVALPWHSSGITLLNTHAVIPTYEYVRLHVTILVTSAKQPRPAYFGRGDGDTIPTSILTSHVSIRKAEEQRRKEEEKREKKARKGKITNPKVKGWWPGGGGNDEKRGPLLDFNSLSYLQTLDSTKGDDAEEHVVKIFSKARLSDEKLEEIFGPDQVKWIYRKQWDAYPYLRPTREFAPVQVDDNLYFPSAMEGLISTMETSTVSARNAVALYLQKMFGFEFVHGGKDCPWQQHPDEDGSKPTDWAGWGCQSG